MTQHRTAARRVVVSLFCLASFFQIEGWWDPRAWSVQKKHTLNVKACAEIEMRSLGPIVRSKALFSKNPLNPRTKLTVSKWAKILLIYSILDFFKKLLLTWNWTIWRKKCGEWCWRWSQFSALLRKSETKRNLTTQIRAGAARIITECSTTILTSIDTFKSHPLPFT